jgi:pimeloyl-ACP methyl ester carboxylesterase
MYPSGLRRVVLEGVGHFLQVEAPDRVNSEILGFLRQLDLRADGPIDLGSAR